MRFLSAAIFLLLFAASLSAEPIPVLIITGGHEFDEAAFHSMFESMEGIRPQFASQPHANELYASSDLEHIQVIIFYDMVQEISEEQKNAFLVLVENGKGLVFLHHSLVSYQHWDEFTRIRGGKYILPESLPESDRSSASTYQHDVRFPVQIIDTKHSVTAGLSDFELTDEVYGNLYLLDSVTPLLRTTHPSSSPIIGWTNRYGASRIVCLQPGHDRRAYENPHYRQLVWNAIVWAAGKD
ncbi:MAG: ThuA domain-containing protein, partial [candidate division KSB1 bacterium]|nr:ThuA domain-containing protein [candidate division KSB1 bacterium]